MKQRTENIEQLKSLHLDVLILGGGINGAVAAAALAGKGVKVGLIDRNDFASGASSNSSNLAWGGIKYLESGELLLVSKLCRSRNHLMRHYPSSVREIRFFTAVRRGFRMPPFFIYLGALFYWVIGAFRTRPPRYLPRRRIAREEPAVAMEGVIGGLEYSDCYLPDNDARFVFRFIRSSMAAGCATANYVEALDSRYGDEGWETRVRDRLDGDEFTIRSQVLINACGPYVDYYNRQIGMATTHQHLFSKGIHLIVDQVTPVERVLTFFASDGRLFFVIPMGKRTCIGTTDTPVTSPVVEVTKEDRQFVLDNANAMLKLSRPLTNDDIIAERCGVRPLAVEKIDEDEQRDWLKLSRRHAIDCNEERRFISIFGGKLTDCINVGEEVVTLVGQMGVSIPHRRQRWYGEPSSTEKQTFMTAAAELDLDTKAKTLLGEPFSERIWRRYGHLAFQLLEDVAADPASALGKPVEFIEYTRCELALMARTEMISKLDDFLRRRSKVAQVVAVDQLLADPGIEELCSILFGAEGPERLAEYQASIPEAAVQTTSVQEDQSGA